VERAVGLLGVAQRELVRVDGGLVLVLVQVHRTDHAEHDRLVVPVTGVLQHRESGRGLLQRGLRPAAFQVDRGQLG
jgi:hypothetical protein